jgi:hypothetical protein
MKLRGVMSETSNHECAQRLTVLAADERFASRGDDLRALAVDIADPEADKWSAINLFSAFPADSVVRLHHSSLLERVVGIVAAVSVFLPVGWTWWGFHDAAAAYERMLADGGEREGTTFLGLWTTGFEGRMTGWHLLVPMALVSLGLIALAIASLVAHRLVADRNVRREERAALAAQAELSSCLTAAQIILDSRRADHPLRIESIVKSSMEKLNKAHTATRKAVGVLSDTSERVSAGLVDMVASLEQAAVQAGVVVDRSREANESLRSVVTATESAVTSSLSKLDASVVSAQAAVVGSISTLDTTVAAAQSAVAGSISTLDGSVSSSVDSARTAMDASGRQLAEGLSASLRSFEMTMATTLDTLRAETVTEVGRAGESLREVVQHIGASAQENSAAASRLTEQIAAMADDNGAARDELNHTIQEVRATLEGIEGALSSHESTLQGHVTELTAARDTAERMLRRLTAYGADFARANGSAV